MELLNDSLGVAKSVSHWAEEGGEGKKKNIRSRQRPSVYFLLSEYFDKQYQTDGAAADASAARRNSGIPAKRRVNLKSGGIRNASIARSLARESNPPSFAKRVVAGGR